MDVVIAISHQAPRRARACILAGGDSHAPELEQPGPWVWVVMSALPLALSQLGGWRLIKRKRLSLCQTRHSRFGGSRFGAGRRSAGAQASTPKTWHPPDQEAAELLLRAGGRVREGPRR